MRKTIKGPIVINCKPRSRYVAVSADKKHTILAEGTSLDAVIKRARKTGKLFAMMFIPKPNQIRIR
jgi:hypothetical protein